MTTLADKAILSGADNCPPMLKKDMHDSWKSKMELYMMNRQHGRMILESGENGPLLWPIVKENEVTRPKKYSELSATEAIQADCDVKATNIILQGLPLEVYALVSNHNIAKELWERIQLLMQGTSLTKQEREYVKLVRDLRTTNVDQLHAYLGQHEYHANEYGSHAQTSTTLSFTYPSIDFQSSIHQNVYNPSSFIPQVEYALLVQQQSDLYQPDTGLVVLVFQKGDDLIDLNSKFVNNMLPEWGRFMTAVKLNRGPRDSIYDQLYASLKQHETHAKENKMMLEQFSQNTVDPLALMSNVSNPQRYSPSSSTSSFTQVPQPITDNPHLESSLSPAENIIENLTNTLALLTQSYKTFLPQTNNQLRTSSNARKEATVQDGRVVVQNVQGVGNVNLGQARSGHARPVKCYNCNGQENGVALDAEQLLFLAGGHDNAFNDDVDEQPVQDLALNVDNVFQADDCDAFDSDVDKAPIAQTMFMVNLVQLYHVVDSHVDYTSDSNMIPYDQYVKDNEEQVELYERRAKFELTEREQKINEQLRLVIFDRNFKEEALKKELHSIKLQLASIINHHKSMVEEVTFLKKDFKQKENKYLEDFLDIKSLKEKVEDRLIKQDQPLQIVHMLCRPNPYYNELNKVAISYKNPLCLTRAKQVQPALYNGHEIIKDKHAPTILHNTEDTLEIAEITRKKMNAKMNDLKCVTRKALTKEIREMKDVFEELKAEVAQYAVDQKHDAIERKNLLIAYDNLIVECLSKEVFSVAINSELNVAQFTEMTVAHTAVEARCLELEAKLLSYVTREAKVVRPLDRSIVSAFRYTKHSQELLEYVIGTCPQGSQQQAKQLAYIPLIRKKQLTFAKPSDKSDSNTHQCVVTVKPQKTSVPVPPSTRVNSCPNASRSQPKSNVKPNRISPAKGVNKLPVKDQPRTNKSHLRTSNRVDSSCRLKRTVINSNSDSICQTCNKCLTSSNHDMCMATCLQSVVATPSIRHNCNVIRKVKQVWKPKQVRQVWKPTGKVLTTIGHQWRPTGQIFNLEKQCLLTRFTPPKVVSAKQYKKWAGRTDCPLVFGFRLLKTYDGGSLTAHEFREKVHQDGNFVILIWKLHSENTLVMSETRMAEAVATACYTQNRSLIHTHHLKTPYELVHNKKPDLIIFRVFGALCYPKNDSEDLGKLQPTVDIKIFVGYAPSRKGYRVYNKRTRRIMEIIHVQFDELTEQMAPVHLDIGLAPNFLMPGQIILGLVPNSVHATPYAPPPIKNWRFYFNQCSINIWNLLVLKDRFHLLKQYKL
uniref:Retrovirus-related Pol polyprotein from transposon TNT 1-94 n=1 Tax=Tanacetum cinerariifolium TaxID=118510 RepID=A0A6L2LY34_TANCI|nr:retrovirus-related Pol polyprotein from transposon TNT 1-94 [Tanacetum cinerariifolium]